MLYKLKHKLFGWDYIHWKNFITAGIARVHVARDGKVYYWRYKTTKVLDEIKEPNQVTWLTCKPEKYFRNGTKV